MIHTSRLLLPFLCAIGLLSSCSSVRTPNPELPGLTFLRNNDAGLAEYALNKDPTVALVRLPADTFVMGAPLAVQQARPMPLDHVEANWYDGPQHSVTIRCFLIAKTPITNQQYSRFREATGHRATRYSTDVRWSRDCQPVVGVSHGDAKTYCNWAGLYLPSEAQWEYACRAGTTTAFWTGDTAQSLREAGAFNERSAESTRQPVGQNQPNPWGLLDTHGSVWEWCEDVWHETYDGAPWDGTPRIDGGCQIMRVTRGGSDDLPPFPSWSRCPRHSEVRQPDIGFRPIYAIPRAVSSSPGTVSGR